MRTIKADVGNWCQTHKFELLGGIQNAPVSGVVATVKRCFSRDSATFGKWWHGIGGSRLYFDSPEEAIADAEKALGIE